MAGLILDLAAGVSLFAAVAGLARPLLWLGSLGGAAVIAGYCVGSRAHGWERLIWDGAAGLALLMAALLAAGQIPGAFMPVYVRLIPLALSGVAVVHYLRQRKRYHREDGHPVPGVGLTLSVLAAVGMLWNRVPPVFFDSLVYHFGQPAMWLVDGRVAPAAWSMVSWFPPGMPLLYGLGLAWDSHAAAADGNLLMILLALALASDLSHRLWGQGAAILTALMLAVLPVTLHATGIPAADFGHGMFSFGTLACWILWRRGESGPWLRRAALLAAGAVLTKYLGLMVPFLLGLPLWLWPGRGTDVSAPPWRRILVFALVPILLLSPWLYANLMVTGNPVAPALVSLVPAAGMAPGGEDVFNLDARGGWPGLTDIERLPRQLLFGDTGSDGIYPSPAWGWFPLLLFLLWLPWRPCPKGSGPLLALLAVQLAIWFVTYRWERFLVAASLTAAVLMSGVALALWRQGRLQRSLLVLVGLLAVLGGLRAGLAVQRFTGGASVAIAGEPPAAFQLRLFPFMDLYTFANATLNPQEDRILMLGETRHYGLQIPHAAPTAFNTHPLVVLLEQDLSDDEITRGLRELGYTHLIVDGGGVARSASRYPSLEPLQRHPAGLRRWLSGLGRPLWQRQRLGLWLLPAVATPETPRN